jgi:preprotein translocase subunit SecD
VRRFIPILILFLGAIALYVDFWPGESGIGSGSRFFLLSDINSGPSTVLETKLGLDLTGGFEITYRAVDSSGKPVDPGSSAMNTIRSIVENRVNSTGVTEPIIETVGTNEILVQVPGATNKTQIESLVGQAGQLEFVLLPPDQYGTDQSSSCPTQPNSTCKAIPAKGSTIDPAVVAADKATGDYFTGGQLDSGSISATVQSDATTSPLPWQINFAFSSQYAEAFANWTGNHVNDYFAIVLDGKVVSAPSIQSKLTGGQGRITGTFTAQEAKDLANILAYGALPYPLQELSSTDVPATLGASFLNQTLFAGFIGVLLVALFMIIYYRLPGVVAVTALAYYGIAVLALFRIVPVTLTLAGIAGFVLSVGMAVDANILIFERTKEELRTGKTLATAVEAGFNRAWNSILDSNVSSLITASILYFGGSSTIKGFALVLIIGVATSMFTAVTVSRTLLRFVVHQGFAQRAWMFGVTDEEFQARAMNARYSRREARGRV